ncbi:hypothetical protein [Novipirellula artificiosorum]|uniref:hypothetical protein n=1 Tax=Novipirellula artificiosorum TaxID=2528016 RepID=UPI0011B657F3|nr:hypothetical protein [Novipirellula artificiosorum]
MNDNVDLNGSVFVVSPELQIMVRLFSALLALTLTVVSSSRDVSAQGRYRGGGHPHSYSSRPAYRGGGMRMGIGIGSYRGYGYSTFGSVAPYGLGYVNDPYQSGSFRVPDLLDDPYFIEQHRFDSRYPGRRDDPRRRRSPLVLRSEVPGLTYQTFSPPVATTDSSYSSDFVVPDSVAGPVADRLMRSSEVLSHALSEGGHGEAWMDYLAPDRIHSLVESGNALALRELLTHYDGVVANPGLGPIATASGFAETRGLLHQMLDPSGN